MEYRKVYFRIRSRYQFDSGWPAETDAAKFHEESRSLFQSAGWDLQPGGDSTSDNLANRFVGELMEQLVQDGLLVTTKTRNGPGVRTATDAEISSPLPGQQQMTL